MTSSPVPLLRPLGAAEIVDAGVQLARRHYGALVTTALVPLLPYFAADAWTSARGGGTPDFWTMVLFSAIWASLADAATARAAFDAYRGGGRPDPARALRATAARAWPVLVSGLYRAVMTTLGLALLLVPGLYVFATYALVPSLAVLEPGLGAWATLRRASALTNGARWRAFAAYVVPYLCVFGANMLVSTTVPKLVGGEGGVGHLVGQLGGSVTAVLLTPLVACLQVVLYLDCRVRKEALDLEWAIADAPPADARAASASRAAAG